MNSALQRILVVGGNGFIGARSTQLFVKETRWF